MSFEPNISGGGDRTIAWAKSTVKEYSPITRAGQSDDTGLTFLSFDRVDYVNSVAKCDAAGNDPTQLIVSGSVRNRMRVSPVIGFVRSGKLDSAINVTVEYRQWTGEWTKVLTTTHAIPANVENYVLACPQTYSLVPMKWLCFAVYIEHAYGDEGLCIDNETTFVELMAWY